MAAADKSWPKVGENHPTDATPIQRIRILRDNCERINSFIGLYPQKKANAAYVKKLISEVLGVTELLLDQTSLPAVDERLSRLLDMLIEVKGTVNRTETLAQSVKLSSIGSSSSGTSGYKDVARWVATAVQGLSQNSSRSNNLSAPVEPLPESLRVRVRIKDQAIAQEIRKLTKVCLRDRVQRAANTVPGPLPPRVKAVQQLKSDDVELYTETIGDAERLQHNAESWIGTFGARAHVLREFYSIVIHGVPVSSVKALEDMGRLLLAESASSFAAAEIVYCGWLAAARTKIKSRTSLKVAFASSVNANRACQYGMVWGGRILCCEVYEPTCKLLQCSHCQAYGHKGVHCRNLTKCAHCAGDHKNRDCPTMNLPKAIRKCANCLDPHEAFDIKCPARIKQYEKIQEAQRNKK